MPGTSAGTSGAPIVAPRFLVTCEHGGNRVPGRFLDLFQSQTAVRALNSHRGWDPGALRLARQMASALGAPLRFSTVTRLLVDLNRGEDSSALFSEFSRGLATEERNEVIRRYHRRYRRRVRQWVRLESATRPVVHLGVHTFTPVLDGHRRQVGIGILFDPDRKLEARVAHNWLGMLREAEGASETRSGASFGVASNEPYLGSDDGLTTTFRGEFSADRYIGLELEVRQDLVNTMSRMSTARGLDIVFLANALREASGQILGLPSLSGPVAPRA